MRAEPGCKGWLGGLPKGNTAPPTPNTQHPTPSSSPEMDALRVALFLGRRLVRADIWQLGIRDPELWIGQLRREGLPIATIWVDATTGAPARYANGAIIAWTGRELLAAGPKPPPTGMMVAYQLCCEMCGMVDRSALGWRQMGPESWNLAEFATCYECIRCLADRRCSETWNKSKAAAGSAKTPS